MKHEILTRACCLGIEYAEQYDTLEEAWMNCQRGDWMLGFAHELNVPIKTLTLAKGLCVKTVLHLMQDSRSIEAVAVAIAFGRGKATREELDSAHAAAAVAVHAGAAYAAAAAAHAAYAASAYSIAYAGDAARAAVDVTSPPGDVAACAADAAHAAAARAQNQKQTADICRKVLTRSVFARLRKLRKENKNEILQNN